MADTFMKQDIQAVYDLADRGMPLGELVEVILRVFARHGDELSALHYSYRLHATDTGYEKAFALLGGSLSLLGEAEEVDVTVLGKEDDLRLVLQRKLSPMAALLRGKVKLKGDKTALIKLAEWL